MTAAGRPAGPAGPHPELDTLADLDAGVLDGPEAERVAGHVASCARCGQVMAALGGMRADLAALPAPPVPAAVAARLDATLAELRTDPGRSAPDQDAVAGIRGPVTDLDTARQRRRARSLRLKTLGSGAAAALVLVVAGASVVSLVRSGGGAEDSLSSAGGGGGSAEQRTTREQEDSAVAPGAAVPTSLPPLPEFDRTSLAAALLTLASAYPVNRAAETGTTGPGGAMADAGLRAACVATIPGAVGTLRAVRWIRYEGRPAYVLVFEDAGAPTAYVVGDQCGRVPSVPATVLATVR